jgi:hypothetical protein
MSSLAQRLVHRDRPTEPRMPRITDLPRLSIVGVALSTCITNVVDIRHSARSVRPGSSARRRRAWTLPSPWTPRTRPQGFGNRTERGFPQRPHPSSYLYEEDRRPKRTTPINLSTDSDQVHPQQCDANPRYLHASPCRSQELRTFVWMKVASHRNYVYTRPTWRGFIRRGAPVERLTISASARLRAQIVLKLPAIARECAAVR